MTQRCNLSCVGCYSEDATRNVLPDPALAQLKHAVSGLAQAGVRALVISGGEPFLREGIAEVAGFAKRECGMQEVSVLTNGTLVSEGAAGVVVVPLPVERGCVGETPIAR